MAIAGFNHSCEQHTVHEREYNNRYDIWVCNKHGASKKHYPWHGEGTTLKRRLWHSTSPAERIRNYRIKAQRYADKLNHEDMYIQHEKDLLERL